MKRSKVRILTSRDAMERYIANIEISWQGLLPVRRFYMNLLHTMATSSISSNVPVQLRNPILLLHSLLQNSRLLQHTAFPAKAFRVPVNIPTRRRVTVCMYEAGSGKFLPTAMYPFGVTFLNVLTILAARRNLRQWQIFVSMPTNQVRPD